MSLLTTIYLIEKYGPLLDVEQLSEVIRIKAGTIRNKLSADTLGIKPIRPGVEPLFPAEDVATYIELLRKDAKDDVRRAA